MHRALVTTSADSSLWMSLVIMLLFPSQSVYMCDKGDTQTCFLTPFPGYVIIRKKYFLASIVDRNKFIVITRHCGTLALR